VAARSQPAPSRGTFFVGIALVVVAAALVAFGFAKLQRHPSGEQLIYAGSGAIYRRDLATGVDTKIASIPKSTKLAEPSPDGKWVAYGNAQGAVWMFDVAGHRRYQIADQATVPVGWSPDSKLMVREIVGNTDLVLIDPNGGRRGLLNSPPLSMSLPVWISSTRFAVGDLNDVNDSLLVDTKASERPDVKANFGIPLAASPDGKQLIYGIHGALHDGRITSSGVTGGRVLFKGTATVVATSPQGFVAFAAKDGVYVLETSTTIKRIVTGQADWLVFSSDGTTILYAKGGAIYAQNVRHGRAKRVSKRGVNVLTLLSFRVVAGK